MRVSSLFIFMTFFFGKNGVNNSGGRQLLTGIGPAAAAAVATTAGMVP